MYPFSRSVLNKGFVRLVSHTQPVENSIPGWTADLEVVRNARVSYDAVWRTGDNPDADRKLINYLIKNHHTSPLEAVSLTFEVKAPIFVLRQWHRHRTWSFNEVSARYSELPSDTYVPVLGQITTQSTSNKQMKTNVINPHATTIKNAISLHNRESFKLYRKLLKDGCPRELARTVLPLSTYSHMFATVNLHNLFNFIRLRAHEHSQYEIQVYAQAMLAIARNVAPLCVEAFQTHVLDLQKPVVNAKLTAPKG
jgi:thymidylate synthase (FAD)